MPYSTQRDRNTTSVELSKAPWPLAPLNLFLTSGWVPGTYDMRWDDPSILALNSRFQILGVNLYRSHDSEFGPYQRVTDFPVGSLYWRDQTDVEVIVEEDVTDKFILFGLPATGIGGPRYVFKVARAPIVLSASQGIASRDPLDVQVRVNGRLAWVRAVNGFAGEVEIEPNVFPDTVHQTVTRGPVPVPFEKVTCSYRSLKSLVRTDLGQRVFYRVTTVGIPVNCLQGDCGPNDVVETPLEFAAAVSNYEVEKLDWIWKEAIRRNRYILEQGGERVKVFLRKNVGIPCLCVSFEHHKQPQGDCLKCYGSGVMGGYEGPYTMIFAPDDAERRIAQKDVGRTLEHSYEVWTGPIPLLSQRDFVVKLNGDRYSVGAVRLPSNRGMVLQQHFNIGHIDEGDIRYKVPMGDPIKFAAVQFATTPPEQGGPTPITDKTNIPDERELRGRTITWENLMYLSAGKESKPCLHLSRADQTSTQGSFQHTTDPSSYGCNNLGSTRVWSSNRSSAR